MEQISPAGMRQAARHGARQEGPKLVACVRRFMCENPLLDEATARRFLEWYASEIDMYDLEE